METTTDIEKKESIPDATVLLSITGHLPLPEKQRKILAVKLLPVCVDMTETKKAKIAGVSETYYYEVLRDPAFKELLVKESRRYLSRITPEITVKYGKKALKNEDIRAQERILEQNGVLDKGETNINVNIQDSNRDVKGKTLHGLGAFDAEWEDVSDESENNELDGDRTEPTGAIPSNDSDQRDDDGTVTPGRGSDTIVDQGQDNQPDSHTAGQNGSAHDSPVRQSGPAVDKDGVTHTLQRDAMKEEDNSNVSPTEGGHPPDRYTDEHKEM